MNTTLNRAAIADIYPLSPMQQGMLFHSLYAPNSGAYEVEIRYELVGQLNRAAFEQAWQNLIDRHAPLRTAFVWENLPQPLQVVGKQVQWAVTYCDRSDLAGLDLAESTLQSSERLQTQSPPGFVLTQAPLMQVTLAAIAPNQHWVIWRYHHLLLDGWSVPILLREFLAFYQAACQDQPLTLAPPVPYSRYIRWLNQQNSAEAEQFWRQTLQGFVAPTVISTAPPAPTPAAAKCAYAEQDLHLSPLETTQLQQWAKQHQLTLNTLVQGAWAILLNRYSDDRDIVFGVVCAGRPAALVGAESMVGLFVNTVPLRVDVSPTQPLELWLQRLQAQQLELQQYAYNSLMEIQRWSEVPRSLPLFETLVIFENYPVESSLKQLQSPAGLAGLQIRNVQGREQTNYPLTLYAIAQEHLSLKLLYDGDRFDAATVEQLLNLLRSLLLGMMQPSPTPLHLGDLPWLTVAEHQQLIAWNTTACPITPGAIHQAFEQQVQQTPTTIALSQAALSQTALSQAALSQTALSQAALSQPNTHLTYAQLNQQANQLAHRLLELNFAPETRIGIYLNRSPQLVIALLAVLKAGATYIPLDPSYPAERLAFMLTDAAAAIVLTQTDLVSQLSGEIPTIAIDSQIERDRIQSQPTDNPTEDLTGAIAPDQLAYLIYTSGSTGQPKGVQVTHQGLVNIVTDLQRTLAIQPSDTLLALTTIAFDIAALELFLPLISGACLWLGSRELALDAAQLATALDQHKITVMQATPTTWRMLINAGWQGKSDLQLLCGGEALDRPLAQTLLDKGAALWNLYGPTETTIWSAVYRVDGSDRAAIPIGRPIANTEFWVLNESKQPVPIGVAGELLIGGAGVARGYWNRPDLSAARFIPLPFAENRSPLAPFKKRGTEVEVPLFKGDLGGSARFYQTGDRVRLLPDGNLEYLGRLDSQVKLRGYRIELGEIESQLQHHPEIAQAVVRLLPDRGDELRLVAYLLPAAPAAADLRQFLASRLPSYMIPAVFVGVSQFPLTPNGKLDRQALPNPSSPREAAGVLPQTDVERSLATLWQTILHLETVGIDDNFFEVGGHSLRMVQLHSAVRDRFCTELTLVDLFRYPTIRALADYLQSRDRLPDPTAADSSFATQVNSRAAELTAGKQRLRQRLQQKTVPSSPASGDAP
jgi:surfactin family lipopeptide synthetase C